MSKVYQIHYRTSDGTKGDVSWYKGDAWGAVHSAQAFCDKKEGSWVITDIHQI